VISFQNELYSAIKKDPATAHLDVVAPSLARGALMFPDVAKLKGIFCDVKNMHSYPGGDLPTKETLDTIQIPATAKLCGEGKPLFATESGYNNAINDPKDRSPVSESAAAKYTNRLFLEYFNRNVNRTYIYQLIDGRSNESLDDKGSHWGLVASDGREKMQFKAMKNLIKILKETGQPAAMASLKTQPLEYSLDGDLTNIHSTLLRKNNGTFYLILWQEVYSYDQDKRKDIVNLDKQIKVAFESPVLDVNAYRPFGSSTPFRTFKRKQELTIGVPDHPLVLEVIVVGTSSQEQCDK
jgi:hypothetical protein